MRVERMGRQVLDMFVDKRDDIIGVERAVRAIAASRIKSTVFYHGEE